MFPLLQDIAGQAYAGGELVWTVRDDVQLDLSADCGLGDDAADVIAAFGVSVRDGSAGVERARSEGHRSRSEALRSFSRSCAPS